LVAAGDVVIFRSDCEVGQVFGLVTFTEVMKQQQEAGVIGVVVEEFEVEEDSYFLALFDDTMRVIRDDVVIPVGNYEGDVTSLISDKTQFVFMMRILQLADKLAESDES